MTRFVHLLKILMASLDHVRSNVCIQVVDVMVLDSVGEGAKQHWDLQVGAAFQSSRCEVPAIFVLAVG